MLTLEKRPGERGFSDEEEGEIGERVSLPGLLRLLVSLLKIKNINIITIIINFKNNNIPCGTFAIGFNLLYTVRNDK